MRGRDPRARLLAGLVAIVVGLAFVPVLGNSFVRWDDHANFLENEGFRGLGPAQFRWAWTTTLLGVYQPLGWMILEGEYAAFRLDPRGYHLVSLLLHVANAVLLYALTVDLLGRARPVAGRPDRWLVLISSGLATTLAMIHPIRAEVVAWASCQPYLPCTLFSLLTVLAYLRGRAVGLTAALVFFAAALLSKAAAVGLPVVLVVLDLYPLRRLGPGRWWTSGGWRVWLEKVPFGLLGLAASLAAVRARGTPYPGADLPGVASRIGRAVAAVGVSLAHLVNPTRLAAHYPWPDRMGPDDPLFLLSLAAVVGISLAAVLFRRRLPAFLAGWVVYLALLAPTLNLVPNSILGITADRYSYLALMGGVPALAATFRWLGRRGRSAQFGLAVAGLGLIACLTVLTWRQSLSWRDSEALWSHALSREGDRNILAHNNLGMLLAERGEFDQAIAHFAEAVRIDPKDPETHVSLGSALDHRGHFAEANAEFREALRLNPAHVEAHYNLGVAQTREGKTDQAISDFNAVLRIKPDHANAHYNLGVILAGRGDIDGAIGQYTEAIRTNPKDAQAHNGLGLALEKQGRAGEAIAEYAEAVRLNPDLVDARTNLGAALAERGQLDEAAAQYAEALRVQHDSEPARRGLAEIQRRQGEGR